MPTERTSRAVAAQALVGRLLCRKWRIDGLINAGGSSWVYSAAHRNGRRVAIKVLRPELAADMRMKRRFLREGYLINRVGHPGVVRALDDDVQDGFVFLVMEFLEGTNLERLCRDGRREPSEVAFFVDGLLDILAAAHAAGIVHRDVKPSNVLLTTKGEIKLLDFGIACLREPSIAPGQTRNGAILGTPGFMAPEQALARSGAVDARMDIWGVGATMFRLLTGRLVHEATSSQASMIATATCPAPRIKTVRADVPDALADLVDRALRFEPDERWKDAQQMQRALGAIRAELPAYEWNGLALGDGPSGEPTLDATSEALTASFVGEPTPFGPRPRAWLDMRPRWLLPALGAGAVAVASLAANVAPQPGEPREPRLVEAPPPSTTANESFDVQTETPRETASAGADAVPVTRATPASVTPAIEKAPAAPAPPALPSGPRRDIRGLSHDPAARLETSLAPVASAVPAALEELLNERR